ncbi:aldo/keto reductase [Roseomonas sp. SSH11]|uniref:Aldo/keto reductase n=1 Tax=Pararoseomonas baculiformis TaxID=2820812 RepID=A0ABS4AEA7_9PROT|nr:aldo/keto reductase [Pararoseomonas baculiformis]MBP0445357.1 aldo/keto reductase [Pararoseomonas baculiformis]
MAETRFAPPGPLGYGGAPLGNMFATVDDATARGALDAAWDGGIRYFDTAPHYGSGLSEHRFGEALRYRPRGEFVLSTKVGRLLRPDASRPVNEPFLDPLPFRVVADYSYDATLRSIEDSLQRLGLDHIEIAFIHDIAEDHLGPGWVEIFDEAMERGAAKALIRLRGEGVIKAWGLGVNRTEPCSRALRMSDPDVFLLAGRYSLLDTAALGGLFAECAGRGAHVVVGGPYNSGLLAGGKTFDYVEAPPERIAARDRIAAVCGRFGVDIRAAALQFCAAHPVVASVIPGAKAADRVRQNIALMAQPIPGDFWQALKREDLLPGDAPTP